MIQTYWLTERTVVDGGLALLELDREEREIRCYYLKVSRLLAQEFLIMCKMCLGRLALNCVTIF